jgi:hypothetical protein
MFAVKGVYKNGKIELLEPLPSTPPADLFIVVVPHQSKEKAAGYETGQGPSGATVMEPSADWESVHDTKGGGATPEAYSGVLRKTVTPDADGFIRIQAPKGFGDCFELFLVPAEHLKKPSEFFEGVDEEGIPYRLDEWTDEEFNVQSMNGAFKGDPTQAEDIFDV